MKATYDELMAFAESLLTVCAHQTSKSRPLTHINLDAVVNDFQQTFDPAADAVKI